MQARRTYAGLGLTALAFTATVIYVGIGDNVGVNPDAVIFIPMMGQSEVTHTGATTPVTTTASPDPDGGGPRLGTDLTLCQVGSSNVTDPLVEDQTSNCWPDGESPASGLGRSLRALIPNHTPAIVVGRCGVGSTSIDADWYSSASGVRSNYTSCLGTSDTTNHQLARLIADVAANPTLYGTTSGAVEVPAVIWAQGEGDEATSQVDYAADLTVLIAAIQTDVQAATGQSYPPVVLIESPSTWATTAGPTTPTGAVLAQEAACAASPTVQCVGPTYAHVGETVSPWYRTTAAHKRLRGQKFGEAIYRAVWLGSHGDSVRLRSASATGRSLTACFTGGTAPYVVDTTPDTITLGDGTGGATATYGTPAHPVTGSLGLEIVGTAATVSGCSAINGSGCTTCTLSTALAATDEVWIARSLNNASTGDTAGYGAQGSSDNAFSNVKDSSTVPIFASHSGVTASVTSMGTIPVIVSLSQSYGDAASTFGGPGFLTAETCPSPILSGSCALWTRPGVSTVAEAAVEQAGDNASTFIVPAVQVLSRLLIAGGGSGYVGIVHQAFPGVRTDSHTTVQVEGDLNQLAALAASYGFVIDVQIFSDNGGGYQLQDLGQPFSTWSNAIESQRAAIATHVATQVGLGTAGYCTTCAAGPTEVTYNDGSLHGAGGTDNVYELHPYSGDFETYDDATHHSCYSVTHIELQPGEGIHPTLVGSTELGDQQARCWYRVLTDGQAVALRATAVTPLSSTQLRITYTPPCRVHGGCTSDPPLSLDTTNQPNRTTVGDVATGGVHFWRGGVGGTIQTPPALSTFAADACAAGATSCTAVLTFASALPDFDAISFCDNAEGPDGNATGAGGCNVVSVTTDSASLNDSTSNRDWQQSSRITVNAYDGGVVVADSGVHPDATADSGPSDSGVHPDATPSDSGVHPDATVSDSGVHPDASAPQYAAFDTDDYATFGNVSTFDGDAEHTRCYWFYDEVLSATSYPAGVCDSADFSMCTLNRLDDMREYIGTGYREYNDQWITASTWHHWCAVFDGSLSPDDERLKSYGDGVRMQTTSGSLALPATMPTPTTPLYAIGARGNGANPFGDGRVACVAEWDVALTRDEILREYHNPCDSMTTFAGARQPEHLWTLDGDLLDTGATGGADGTDQGDITYGTPLPTDPTGYYANASYVEFDGTDDLQACGAVTGADTQMTVVVKFQIDTWPAPAGAGCNLASIWGSLGNKFIVAPNESSGDILQFWYEGGSAGRLEIPLSGAGDGEEIAVAYSYNGSLTGDTNRLIARIAENGAGSWTTPSGTYFVSVPATLASSGDDIEIMDATYAGAAACDGRVSFFAMVRGDAFTSGELDTVLGATGEISDPSTWATAPTQLYREGDSAGDSGTTIDNAGSAGATNDCTLSNGAAITAGSF